MTEENAGRLYALQVIATGGLILSLAIVLTVLTLFSVLGPFRFLEQSPHRDRVLGLWHPPSSEGLSAPATRAWRAVAPSFAIREATSLDELVRENLGVVAVSDARGLTRGERRELERFVAAGGAAVVTGPVGTRAEDGTWRGLGLMTGLLRTRALRPLPMEATEVVQAATRGPLSAALSPGERLVLTPTGDAVAVESEHPELRWSALGSALEEGTATGATLRVTIGEGKLVWLGAGPGTAASVHAADAMARLVDAAAAWARDEPYVELLPWPSRAPFAARFGETSGLFGLSAAPPDPQVLTGDIQRAAHLGSLVRIPLPLEPAEADPQRELSESARAEVERLGGWLPGPGEISRWHQLRADIDLRSERVGPHRVLLHVTNRNEAPVRHIVLRVHLNQPVARVEVGRTTVQQEIPNADVELDLGRVDLALPELPPGANRSFTIDLEPASAAADR